MRKHIKAESTLLAPGISVLTAVLLVGCGSLHDESYNWCQGQSCAAPQPPTTTPAPPPPPPVVVVPPAPAPTPAAQRVTLSADALFKFDRATLQDMLPQGRSELDALARTLRTPGTTIDSITITGHTDRLGSAAYNERLSQQRAETVRAYLQAAGITAPIQVRGIGEREPVSLDCKGNTPTPQLISCLQPDRRVDVEVVGRQNK